MIRKIKSKLSVLLRYPWVNRLRGTPLPHGRGECAQQWMAEFLLSSTAGVVGRTGQNESALTAFYVQHRLGRGASARPYPVAMLRRQKAEAGIFFDSASGWDSFALRYLHAARNMHIHAVWHPFDAVIGNPQARRITLWDLDPFFFSCRWTAALESQNVCVVTPFDETVRNQYAQRREVVFDPPLLPDMALHVVRAPQTIADVSVDGLSWDRNLEELIDRVLNVSAGIVIIGAGGYSLPAAHAIAQHGRKVIAYGGATQLLFGIRGRRWENDPRYARLMNQYWVRPAQSERPPGFGGHEIEGGAYW